MAEQKNRMIVLGVFVSIVIGLFIFLALKVGSIRTGGGIQVDAFFDDAQGLVENGNVRIAGIKAGSIGRLVVDDGRARVTLYIDPAVKARQNIRATIKAKSLLGEKFIELIPQGDDAPLLKNGDVIRNTFISAELPDLASQIGPLLSKIDPDDVARMVRVISKILDEGENDIPKAVEAMGNIAINLDTMLSRNGPKIDSIVDAAYDAVSNAGPKVEKLVDSTQRTLDNANRMIEVNSPRIDDFMKQLSQIDIARINRMIADVDTAMDGAPEMMDTAKSMLKRANLLLAGFEGLTWYEVRTLVRDDGVNVRMSGRSDSVRAEERERWARGVNEAATATRVPLRPGDAN
jgi:phospholipid/cholesterol/gamma-HCH transport system substrate-binding protein